MTQRKKNISKKSRANADIVTPAFDDQIATGNLSLHELFQQQTLRMLESTDLSEEQKQSVLVAMNCPCCGAGGMSFTAKLKRRS